MDKHTDGHTTYIRIKHSFVYISKLPLSDLVQQLHIIFTERSPKYWAAWVVHLCIVLPTCCVCVHILGEV